MLYYLHHPCLSNSVQVCYTIKINFLIEFNLSSVFNFFKEKNSVSVYYTVLNEFLLLIAKIFSKVL